MALGKTFVCLEDFEKETERKLDLNARGYYQSGAMNEETLRDNVKAYSRYLIRPKVLVDVSNVDLQTTILGQQIAFPICASPTGVQCLAHPDGENAAARACARMNTCLVLSSWSNSSLEDVSKATPTSLKWYQIEIFKDTNVTRKLVQRAESAGYKALAVTIDVPIIGQRLADLRNGSTLPPHLSFPNFDHFPKSIDTALDIYQLNNGDKNIVDTKATWKSIDWLRSITSLPIVLKGILRAEDAREALCHDVQGIIVSNHGARQLDGVPATIDVLSEIVQEVGGKIEVFIDGGIRHGTDVLKALSLGARAVFVGRPILWGLACKGEEGAYEVLSLLKEELRHAMVLSGCANITDVHTSSNLVVHKTYYTYPKAKL